MSDQSLYEKMFEAKQAGNQVVADELMRTIEEKRRSTSTTNPQLEFQEAKSKLPIYALNVLGKSQKEIDQSFNSNCINAAFNFHSMSPRIEPYSPMEFLNIIRTEYIQLEKLADIVFGDLVVMWWRTGGSWDKKKIIVSEFKEAAPDFPYGLVFDHVAVMLGNNLVFHKPDPTLESLYQIDYLNSAISVTKSNQGFELTYHRKVGEQ